MDAASGAKDKVVIAAAPTAERVRIAITPMPGAWMVEASFNESPLIFQTRAGAARSAQKLAQAAAASGRPVELHIHPEDN